jgi:hypothetical protein
MVPDGSAHLAGLSTAAVSAHLAQDNAVIAPKEPNVVDIQNEVPDPRTFVILRNLTGLWSRHAVFGPTGRPQNSDRSIKAEDPFRADAISRVDSYSHFPQVNTAAHRVRQTFARKSIWCRSKNRLHQNHGLAFIPKRRTTT